MEIKVQTLECKRCRHQWVARKSVVRVCPKCKSPYWDKDKEFKKGKKDSQKLWSQS